MATAFQKLLTCVLFFRAAVIGMTSQPHNHPCLVVRGRSRLRPPSRYSIVVDTGIRQVLHTLPGVGVVVHGKNHNNIAL